MQNFSPRRYSPLHENQSSILNVNFPLKLVLFGKQVISTVVVSTSRSKHHGNNFWSVIKKIRPSLNTKCRSTVALCVFAHTTVCVLGECTCLKFRIEKQIEQPKQISTARLHPLSLVGMPWTDFGSAHYTLDKKIANCLFQEFH